MVLVWFEFDVFPSTKNNCRERQRRGWYTIDIDEAESDTLFLFFNKAICFFDMPGMHQHLIMSI